MPIEQATIELAGIDPCQGGCPHCMYGKDLTETVGLTAYPSDVIETYKHIEEVDINNLSLLLMNIIQGDVMTVLQFIQKKPNLLFTSAGSVKQMLSSSPETVAKEFERYRETCTDNGSINISYQNENPALYDDDTLMGQFTDILLAIYQRLSTSRQSYHLNLAHNSLSHSKFEQMKHKVMVHFVLLNRLFSGFNTKDVGDWISINVEQSEFLSRGDMGLIKEGLPGVGFGHRYITGVSSILKAKLIKQLLGNMREFHVTIYPTEVRLFHTAYTIRDPEFSFSHKDFRMYLAEAMKSDKSPQEFFRDIILARMGIEPTPFPETH